MKPLLLLWVFIVTWNEYELKHTYFFIENGKEILTESAWESVNRSNNYGVKFATVELTTKTIKLATQGDVDLFLGTQHRDMELNSGMKWRQPYTMIGDAAFAIYVKEEK